MEDDYLKNNTYCTFNSDRLLRSCDVSMKRGGELPTSCPVSRSYGEAAVKTLSGGDSVEKKEYYMSNFEKAVTRELGKLAIRSLGF